MNMPEALFRLDERVIVLTGATRGIGRAMATLAVGLGARVTVASRSSDDCRAVADELNMASRREAAWPCAFDLGDPESGSALVEASQAQWGGIDVLIANAGLGFGGSAGATSAADFTRAFQHNVVHNNLLAQAALPSLRASGGNVVFVASASALAPSPTAAAYATSKRALIYLMQNLAVEWGPHGVRVNALVPGLTRTDPTRYVWKDEATLRSHTRLWPLGRIADPVEPAAAGLFLASRAAGYITGHALVCDGGRTLVTGNSLLPEPDIKPAAAVGDAATS